VFNPPIFKRVYVDDEEFGIPYVTGSTLLEARPAKEAFLSRARTGCLAELTIREGMVLISDSGSIGRTVLATREIDGWASTNNLIRVISTERARFSQEFFYTFFITSVGQYLLTRSTYGSVVEHIEPAHVRETPFPVLPHKLCDHLTELVERVSALRVKANALLGEADREVQVQCCLPNLCDLAGPHDFLSGAGFVVPSDEVFGRENQFGAVRLDATYYDPLAVKFRSLVLSSGGSQLESLLENVYRSSLRKRTFVDGPDAGVPMVGGKQLLQIRASDVKYLSKALTRSLRDEVIEEHAVLVSCGGTLGRPSFVHRNWENWAVSEDVMRLTAKTGAVKPGFLFAFLASDYGQIQIRQRAYGSVIPRLRDFQFHSIAIAVPPDRGQAIHDIVVRAFDFRADALALENEAIRLFEAAIEEGRDATEEKWGREY
jgi:type I restriction enzyme S subunit